jgi:hypothetical protein
MLTFEGLTSGQVLQRAFTGGPPAAVSVACDRAGELWMRVTAADGPLEGFRRRVLRSAGEASGFAVRLPNRAVLDAVYRVDLDGGAAILRTSIPAGKPRSVDVYYGYGTAPRCTIVDADDRSIPAFGPVRVALPARPEVKGR